MADRFLEFELDELEGKHIDDDAAARSGQRAGTPEPVWRAWPAQGSPCQSSSRRRARGASSNGG